VHDLAPMVLFSFNADFRLDAAEAARLSPARLEPWVDAPLLVAVGGAETSEFLRQAQLQWDAWPAQRPPGSTGPLVVPGKDHFSVVADHADPGSALTRGLLALLAARRD
jgi:arylformamidase